jgi:adenine-specific DNA-methyltransferase
MKFISGSKSISKLPDLAKILIEQFIENNDEILIGDCYGVDVAVQKYLESKGYCNVTIYCSGESPRNNFVTGAKVRSCTEVAKDLTGSEFHYVKDIEMACDCDQALMIWDGKSKGTGENIRRIKEMGKPYSIINED